MRGKKGTYGHTETVTRRDENGRNPLTTSVHFEWGGGAYIDISFGGSRYAVDVINVYDYAAGHASIQGRAAFMRECREWLANLTRHDLLNYCEASRY